MFIMSPSSSRVGRRPCAPVKVSCALSEVALQAAQRARRPVAAPQLVEDRSVDARPEVRLQARALPRVVAVDRADQALDAARDQVVDLARRRQLADLLVDDVLDERHVGEHQPVSKPHVTGRLVLLPAASSDILITHRVSGRAARSPVRGNRSPSASRPSSDRRNTDVVPRPYERPMARPAQDARCSCWMSWTHDGREVSPHVSVRFSRSSRAATRARRWRASSRFRAKPCARTCAIR